MTDKARSPFDLSMEQLDAVIADAADLASTTERRILNGPVSRGPPDPQKLRERIGKLDLEQGSGSQAMETILKILEKNGLHNAHPRYFGLFNPAPVAWGQAADLISARLNPQLAVWSHAPAAVEMELAALDQIACRIGWSCAGSFFTSGGEEANRCAVQVALASLFPSVTEEGLPALERPPVFYASSESHLAWLKIAAGCGLGRRAVRLIPVDVSLQMNVEALERAILEDKANGCQPFLAIATAGTTSAGAIDRVAEIAEVTNRHSLHLHVDAAWAGAVVLSDRWRGVLAGIERADSVTIDAHKWLSQPMGTGMFLAKEADLASAFAVSTSYMPDSIDGTRDFYASSPQWSRPFRGLRLFLTLAVLGRSAFERQIDRDVALGEELRRMLERDGWTIANDTPLPVVCFARAGHENDTHWHKAVATRVIESGEAWISTVELGGRPALRACITSFRTETADLDALTAALRSALD